MEMRTSAAILAVLVSMTALEAADKLTVQDKIELIRGLDSEYATVKRGLPRSKKALPLRPTGQIDTDAWEADGPQVWTGGARGRPGASHESVDRRRPAGAADQSRI